MRKVTAIIPIKMNSKRLPNKNLLKIGEKSLIENTCSILQNSKIIKDVYVYSSSKYLEQILPKGIKFLERNIELDSDETSMNQILKKFSEEIISEIYVLVHSTAPFITIDSIDSGIEAVLSGNYDSSFSVRLLKEFIWDEKNPLNYNLENIPRTQDLKGYYIETSGFYVFERTLITDFNRRIGFNPKKILINDIEAIDIDEKLDYEFAQLIFKQQYNLFE